MKFYRFLNAEYGLLALQTKKWKLGRVSELNDPLDCHPVIHEPGIEFSGENSPEVKARLETFYQMSGLICFSTAIQNPVIWSHYADKHRGLAFEFEWPENSPRLRKVRYSADDKPYSIQRKDFDVSWDDKDKAWDFLNNALTLKAKSWSYEEEYREFVSLQGCEMIGAHYFIDFPIANLTGIYLGLKSKLNEFDLMKLVCSVQKNPENTICWKMTFDGASFSLGKKVMEIRPLLNSKREDLPEVA